MQPKRVTPTICSILCAKALGDMEELHAKRSNAGAIQDDEDETKRREGEVSVEEGRPSGGVGCLTKTYKMNRHRGVTPELRTALVFDQGRQCSTPKLIEWKNIIIESPPNCEAGLHSIKNASHKDSMLIRAERRVYKKKTRRRTTTELRSWHTLVHSTNFASHKGSSSMLIRIERQAYCSK